VDEKVMMNTHYFDESDKLEDEEVHKVDG
jgi:hypothetical protein